MFHEYFGVAEDPFSITPDTRYLFQSDHHRNAFTHLLYGVADAGGFVQLTGEVGTGKALLCRSLIAQLPEEVNMALIFNPRLTPLELVATLFAYWQTIYPQEDEALSACERAEQVGLSCIYGRGNWQNLELYNSPAVIELGLVDGRRYQVVVAALDAQRVTLDLASRRLTFYRQEIASLWTGSYIVLWRPPKLSIEPLTQGLRGRDIAWLVSRMDRIEGVLSDFDPNRVRFDRALKQRVTAFQQSRGLVADGIVGCQTIIHMSVAVSDPLTPTLNRGEG
jgi:hypothetical protein